MSEYSWMFRTPDEDEKLRRENAARAPYRERYERVLERQRDQRRIDHDAFDSAKRMVLALIGLVGSMLWLLMMWGAQ